MLSPIPLATHEIAALPNMTAAAIRSRIKSIDLRPFHMGREWRVAPIDPDSFMNDQANRRDRVKSAEGIGPPIIRAIVKAERPSSRSAAPGNPL